MKSVSICGSKKYAKEIAAFADELEAAGVLVFDPNFKQPMPESKKFESEYIKGMVFKGFTLEHFDWIKKSEVCYIYNKDGYIGRSVSLELGYAVALGKPIFALEPDTKDPCSDGLIDKVISTPKELIKIL